MTIEKYFNGEMDDRVIGKKVEYYPEFRLPTLEERQLILHYSDSIEKKYVEKRISPYASELFNGYPPMYCKSSKVYGELPLPTIPVDTWHKSKKEMIYNLRGNVSELTAEPGISVGGSWRDTRERILSDDIFPIIDQRYGLGSMGDGTLVLSCNTWTGFRNVFQWKKWEK